MENQIDITQLYSDYALSSHGTSLEGFVQYIMANHKDVAETLLIEPVRALLAKSVSHDSGGIRFDTA